MQGVDGRITGLKKTETTTLTLKYVRWFELLDFVLPQYKVVFLTRFSPQNYTFKQVESVHCLRQK